MNLLNQDENEINLKRKTKQYKHNKTVDERKPEISISLVSPIK